MTCYAFYIFDRHAECIYSRRWHPLPTARDCPKSGDIIPAAKEISKEDDAKLIFGVAFSIRNMAKKLGGDHNSFLSSKTKEYKLHYFETLTRLKFIMITDLKTGSLRVSLQQIWSNLYVEHVVKNPLSPVEHPGGLGVANEMFEATLDAFVTKALV